jgi:hypothetical protein
MNKKKTISRQLLKGLGEDIYMNGKDIYRKEQMS